MSQGYGSYGQQGHNSYGYDQGWGGANTGTGSGYQDQPQDYQYGQAHTGGLDNSGLPVMPSMSATFVPGGDDDWTMPAPELISPAPQRIMPEVPTNIADSIGTLEKASTQLNRHHSVARAAETPAHRDLFDEPSWTPFPKLQNPGPNIPPTDDEKERYLESARLAVLASDDPDTQLAWAQDSLNYVDTSLQYLTRTSEDGRPQTPAVEYQLRNDSLNIVNFLAEQHHPKAEFMKGTWLEFGKLGFRVDRREAFRCYARAAERGYARAEYRMGMQYENSNEPMKAIKHYTQGAALNDSASNYRLGMMTLLGQHGQIQDYGRGVSLVRQAAETADENAPQGAYVYGLMLARDLPGLSIPEIYLSLDVNQAKVMIEKAAFLGFAKAQVKMAQAYELCQLGCQFDPALSLHYNALASRQGEPEADMAISKWFLCGHEGVFNKNEELAFKYAQQAAKTGLPTAEFAMGYFYEIGMQVVADLAEARNWYQKAAAHGNKDAKGRLEGISRSRTLSRKDHERVALPAIRATRSVRVPNRPASSAVDMPNPIIPPAGTNIRPQFPQLNSAGPRSSTPGFINPATGTIQPFVSDNGAIPPPRGSSITPYPPSPTMAGKQSFGPPGRPSTAMGPTTRPGSAAPLTGPLVRPQTAVPAGVLVPAGTYPTHGGRGGPVQRPASAFSSPNPSGSGFPTSQPLRPHGQGRGAPPVENVPYPGFEAPLPVPRVDKPAKPSAPIDHTRKQSLTPQPQSIVGPRPSPTPKPQVPAPVIQQSKPVVPAPVTQSQAHTKPLPTQPLIQAQTKPSVASTPPVPPVNSFSTDSPAPPKSPTGSGGGASGKKRFEDYEWLPTQQKEQECIVM
ncbi:hypothetical protein H072_5884 [Dactylellina haptotyla CBS 200.50]|uniref:Chitin synthase activator n=1 Tax=Dactylellina haptotyla (strain CBS 200.50) TaxID=1284197 RepID=S8BY95_DACHA|nr:hypothetical protein H072_5884 [Dactylellina haptotyla CBS 200.50]